MTEAVKVIVRCRPMSQKQLDRSCQNILQLEATTNQVRIYKDGSHKDGSHKEVFKAFSFDCVFGPQALQSNIYEETAFALVDNVLEGYNGTIFAYGQTGCGKTHTMMGQPNNEESRGIIPRTFSQIVTLNSVDLEKKHLVHCSFIEIYNEQIHDLLGRDIKARLEIKETPDKGVYVKDIAMNLVKTVAEMEKFMQVGFRNRAVRQTAMNKESSRSHSIFTIYIESSELDQLGAEKFKVGKLNLVDLAGSERQSKTNATGDGMKQAAKINLSLSALGNVISALVDGKAQHIPYRDSKLTRLLQDSLGGNTKTIMIAAVSPADYNFEQTMSTLRYASRAKFIQNKPIVNQDPKDALLKQYADEIKALKIALEGRGTLQMPMRMPMRMPMQFGAEYSSSLNIQLQSFMKTEKNGQKQLHEQLRSKQQLLREEQEGKKKLQQQLEMLQSIVGKTGVEVDKREVEKLKKMKEKLKTQKKKQEEWAKDKKKREEQFLSMEKNYKSLNQEIQEMRTKYSQIKTRYIQNLTEINELHTEHQREKRELLDAVRSQECQINKFSSILKMIMTEDQIQDIVSRSEYNDETREWSIVPFYYREKSVNFPKISSNREKLIKAERQKKQIVFRDAVRLQNDHIEAKAESTHLHRNRSFVNPILDYKISSIVRDARLVNPTETLSSQNLGHQWNTIEINSNREFKSLTEMHEKGIVSRNKKIKPYLPKPDLDMKGEKEDISSNSLGKIKLNPIMSKKQLPYVFAD